MSNSATTTVNVSSRKALQFFGDWTGPIALFLFGIGLWYFGEKENIFSFAAWATLDILSGASMFYNGSRKEAVLPIAYGVFAFFVTAMIYQNGSLQWGLVENLCAAGVAIAVVGWFIVGPLAAVIASSTAALIASIPIFFSTYHEPHVWEAWLWVGSAVSATIGLYMSRPWTINNISDWLFVSVSEAVTVIMLILLLIRPLFF